MSEPNSRAACCKGLWGASRCNLPACLRYRPSLGQVSRWCGALKHQLREGHVSRENASPAVNSVSVIQVRGKGSLRLRNDPIPVWRSFLRSPHELGHETRRLTNSRALGSTRIDAFRASQGNLDEVVVDSGVPSGAWGVRSLARTVFRSATVWHPDAQSG